MKHIKKIDDVIFEKLYKSTYLSAHDKLRNQHPSRASKLKEWAAKKGKSEFSNGKVDRVWPYKFELYNNELIGHVKEDFLGYFSITGMYCDLSDTRVARYKVQLMNDYGQKIEIRFVVKHSEYGSAVYTTILLLNIHHDFSPNRDGEMTPRYENRFLFDRRLDALQFKRYLVEEGIPDLEDHPKYLTEFISSISVNDLYKTK